jgi:hypothetical protein
MQPGIAERCPSRACVPTLVGVRVGLLHSIDRAKPSLDGWSWLDQLRNVEADCDDAPAQFNRIEMSAERCLRGVCPAARVSQQTLRPIVGDTFLREIDLTL